MILRRVARPLLASIFVWGGVNALRHLEGHAEVAKPFLDKTVGKAAAAMSDRLPDAVPTEPNAVVAADAAAKILAGLALATGRLPRLAALVLTASLVPTTLAAHSFWKIEDPQERNAQRIQFLKNLGLLGGLMLASADTEGRPSLGWRTRKAGEWVADGAHDLAHDLAQDVSHLAHDVSETVAGRVKELLPS
jgi:uncharacterized membrane protein YphA (DoxX/SURF4 family)